MTGSVRARIRRVRRLLTGPTPRRVLGGMIATPWFAVSAGLAAAAWLALGSPGPQLRFPSGPDANCRIDNCVIQHGAGQPVRPQGGARPGEAGTGIRVPGPGPRGAGRVTGGSAAPLVIKGRAPVSLRYRMERSGDQFVAVFLVTGRKNLGDWTLGLGLRHAVVELVIGATWNQTGAGTVVISGSPPPWQNGGSRMTRFTIIGSGWPDGGPDDCVYNGERCSFGPALND